MASRSGGVSGLSSLLPSPAVRISVVRDLSFSAAVIGFENLAFPLPLSLKMAAVSLAMLSATMVQGSQVQGSLPRSVILCPVIPIKPCVVVFMKSLEFSQNPSFIHRLVLAFHFPCELEKQASWWLMLIFYSSSSASTSSWKGAVFHVNLVRLGKAGFDWISFQITDWKEIGFRFASSLESTHVRSLNWRNQRHLSPSTAEFFPHMCAAS